MIYCSKRVGTLVQNGLGEQKTYRLRLRGFLRMMLTY